MRENILVLGGTGNLSKYFCQYVLEKTEYDIHIVTRGIRPSCFKTTSGRQPNHIIHDINKDGIKDCSQLPLDNLVGVVDFICYSEADVMQRMPIMKNLAAPYIYISTTAFYDRRFMKFPLKEDELVPWLGWTYARNKYKAELAFQDTATKFGFKQISLRLGHTLGSLLPVSIGNPNRVFSDRLTNNLSIPQMAQSNLPWSVGTALGLSEVIVNLLINVRNIPSTISLHYSSQNPTSWSELYQLMLDIYGSSSEIILVPNENLERIAPHWSPSVIFHKSFRDIYCLEKLYQFVPIPSEDSLQSIILSAKNNLKGIESVLTDGENVLYDRLCNWTEP